MKKFYAFFVISALIFSACDSQKTGDNWVQKDKCATFCQVNPEYCGIPQFCRENPEKCGISTEKGQTQTGYEPMDKQDMKKVEEPCTAEKARKNPYQRYDSDFEYQQRTAEEKGKELNSEKSRLEAEISGFDGKKLPTIPEEQIYLGDFEKELKQVPELRYDGRCELVVKSSKNEVVSTNLSWPVLANKVVSNINDFAPFYEDDEDSRLGEVKWIFIDFFYNFLGHHDVNTVPYFFQVAVINTEVVNEVGKAFVPHLSAMLNLTGNFNLKSWLPLFWAASQENMVALEDGVKKFDKEEKNESNYGKSYYDVNNKHFEGWFLRRWIMAGRGDAANDLLVVYRFWIYKVAVELKHPLADAWRGVLINQFKATTSLDAKPYLAQLK